MHNESCGNISNLICILLERYDMVFIVTRDQRWTPGDFSKFQKRVNFKNGQIF